MKILITGASGQLGRALLATAPDRADIIAPGRSDLDLADADAVHRLVVSMAPDLLINAGAYTAVDRAEAEPEIARAINSGAVGAMAAALREVGGRLLQVSTDFVFDGEASRAYLPADQRNPLSVYGSSKAAGEDAAGPDATVIRTAWVHGAGGTNFVSAMLQLMRTHSEVRVVADQIGAPTWTGELADVIWKLASRYSPGTWHWTDAGVASWYDFAVAIQEEALTIGLLDRAVPIVPIPSSEYPRPAARPRFSVLDSRKTRRALDLDAVHWRKNLRRMLREESVR